MCVRVCVFLVVCPCVEGGAEGPVATHSPHAYALFEEGGESKEQLKVVY